MRRRFALVLLLLAFGSSLLPLAIRAQESPPDPPGGKPLYTPLNEQLGELRLAGFTFEQQYNEITWFQYDAEMTVYVLAGSFAFDAEAPNGTVMIDPPRGSTCLEIQDGREFEENGAQVIEYLEVEEPNKQCFEVNGAPCLRRCEVPTQGRPKAVILEPGSVLYLPKETFCFVCAISATGARAIDITVLNGELEQSWKQAATENEVPPNSPEQESLNSTPGAFRLLHIPARNPGGCAGKTG
jgi:hypothetical protein